MARLSLSITSILIGYALTSNEVSCWSGCLDALEADDEDASKRELVSLLQIQTKVLNTDLHEHMLEPVRSDGPIDDIMNKYNNTDIKDLYDSALGSVNSVRKVIEDFGNYANDTDHPLNQVVNVANHVKHAVEAGKSVAGTASQAAKGYEQLRELTADKPLGGSSKERINMVLIVLVAAISSLLLIVYYVEKTNPNIYDSLNYSGPAKQRPALWVLTMLFVSYLLLIPALYETLFSFKVGAKFMGLHVCITSDNDHKPGAITESTLEVIRLLYDTGSSVGAIMVTLYAIIVPTLKLILLSLGEWLREGHPNDVQRSRACIIFVQYISKWACPDMFAYILLLYLLRHLPEHSDGLIEAPSKLDVGFTCFSIFCILSTFSSLAIVPPPKAAAADDGGNRFANFRPTVIYPIAVSLCAVFAVLLFVGLGVPCMGLDISEDALIYPTGPIPLSFKPMLHQLHLSRLVNSKVPLWRCITSMAGYAINEGEFNCVLAVVMLGIFAVMLPICSMVMLTQAALQIPDGGVNTALPKAKVLAKIAMLDVFCMGVVVVSVAAGMYHKMGINVYLQPGIALLIAAEFVHYLTYWFVQGAVEAHSENKDDVAHVS